MTKVEYLYKLQELYRVANMGDSDHPDRPSWIEPAMAGEAGCRQFDNALHAMVKCGALTKEDEQAFYDTL